MEYYGVHKHDIHELLRIRCVLVTPLSISRESEALTLKVIFMTHQIFAPLIIKSWVAFSFGCVLYFELNHLEEEIR